MPGPFSMFTDSLALHPLVHNRVTDVPAIFAYLLFGHGETSLGAHPYPFGTERAANSVRANLGLARNFRAGHFDRLTYLAATLEP